ncbi:hypothetical protein SORBI_3005G019250 [Sorghum bicolor]|uniref:Uncharacterized protein n=1 Tax=Sorghum bicolor TaxID=4558 RepID=A0A1Z5RG68_SORBI|nr:hypothetical protein SORBI_3005G019250 [Sorghum bicolor]
MNRHPEHPPERHASWAPGHLRSDRPSVCRHQREEHLRCADGGERHAAGRVQYKVTPNNGLNASLGAKGASARRRQGTQDKSCAATEGGRLAPTVSRCASP